MIELSGGTSVAPWRLRAAVFVTVALALGLACLASGCGKSADVAPAPQMMVFAERNRMVWISMHDSDQPESAQVVWDAAEAAESIPAVEITREEVDVIMRTGSAAASYYAEVVSIRDLEEILAIVVVVEPGESTAVQRGDILMAKEKQPYFIVGRASADSVETVEDFVYRRMGLR